MNKDQLRQLVVLVAILGNIIVTILANVLPFNGQTTSEITSKYLTFLTPADYAFAIWDIIYIGLIGFGIYQVLPSVQQNTRISRISYWVVLNCLATCAWLVLWSYELMIWSVGAMLLMLLSLIGIYQGLEMESQPESLGELWLVRVPFSIYFGWITVTIMANVAVALSKAQWDGWGISPSVWAVILTIASFAIAGVIILHFADIAYAMSIVWVYLGILVNYFNIPLVAYGAGLTTIGSISLLLFAFWRKKKYLGLAE